MINIIITLLIVLYRISLINMLGDKGMGYYSIALSIYLLLMTCVAYGLPNSLSMILTKHHAQGKYKLLYQTIQASFLFSFIAGGGLSLLVFFGADILAEYVMKASFSAYAIRAIAPCLLIASVAGVLHGTYYGTKLIPVSRFSKKAEEFFVAVLSIAGVYLFTKWGKEAAMTQGETALEAAYSAMGAALGLSLGVFAACVYMLLYFKRYHQRLKLAALKDTTSVKETAFESVKAVIKYMLPFILTLVIFHLSSVTDYAIFNRIMSVQGHKENDYMILLGMLNGKYEFFLSLPLLAVNWYASSVIPAFKQIAESGNKRKMLSKTGQLIRYLMLFIIPCTTCYILYAQPLMNLVFTGINETAALLLKAGAASIVFYSLTAISNAVLNAIDQWFLVAKNAFYSLIIQVVSLLLMMIIFEWGIMAVIISRILFSVAFYVFNEHSLRECTGYVQEHKRSFKIPVIASLIMGIGSYIVYFIADLFLSDKIAVLAAIPIGIIVYVMALVFLGGITQHEMYRLPFGKYLAPLCRKLHLVK